MNNTALRFSWVALAIAALVHAPRSARADDQPQPSQPQPPPGYVYPAPAPYQGPPPAYAPQPPSGPEKITNFDESQPVPYGYTKVSRTRKGMVIGGAVTLGVTYGISAFAAAIGEDLRRTDVTATDVSALWLPIVGPFMQLGRTTSSTGRFYLVQLGIAETAGAIMLVYGLTSPKVMLIRNDKLSMTVAPMLTNGATGLAAVGTF